MVEEKKHLIIIDSNSVIHRAYHALPPLTTKKGEGVNAIYGFLLVFFKIIKEFRPDYVAACFDLPAPTFRHKKYKKYKAKRPPTPEDLKEQILKVKEILKSFHVAIFEKTGFEADDLIGTISKKNLKEQSSPKVENIILSGDLDTLQLVDENTKICFLRRGVKDLFLYDANSIKARYQGLEPEQILDFKALKGDPSDNVPGVTGVGEKTAVKLVGEFGSLENLYQELEKDSGKTKKLNPRFKKTLLNQKKQAFFSKTLLRIETDAPINFDLKECRWGEYDQEKVSQIFKDLEFYSLIERLSVLKKNGRDDTIKEAGANRQNTLF